MTTPLQLKLVNNSTTPGNLFVFQQFGPTSTHAVAWLSKYAYPGTSVSFSWDPTSWCFVWSGSGQLSPGVVFDIAQVVPADVADASTVPFSYDPANRVFFFGAPQSGGQPGTLSIRMDGSIPLNAAVVGIGMAGKAAFLVNAQPNINATFTPRPSYWVGFAPKVQQGEYVDVTTISVVEVVFPFNVYAMTAAIDEKGHWSVTSNVLDKAPVDQS